MNGVHVAHFGLDGVVIGGNFGDGTHEAAAHQTHRAPAHAPAHAAAATALAVTAAISRAGILV